MMMKKPEILAPVGSSEAFYSAIAAGCDAVYLGGKSFGARAYANNFTYDELNELVSYAHLFNVKIYYTLNTIVKDPEFKELRSVLKELSALKLDGLIIQDLGVYHYIKENFSDFIIHASTQMNLHCVEDAKMADRLGFDRIVVSRECSLKDIKGIKEKVDIEIEAFVHGALCYSYSGQCLMSSIYGGRSGNRGKCAQPCRLAYTIDNEQAYFLSPKDQMTLGLMPDLIKAGIDSFKIEGRMKGPEYVYKAVALYKKYRDIALDLIEEANENSYMVDSKDIEVLNQLFNRGNFTDGYYKRHNGKDMISYDHSKNYGVKVGQVSIGKDYQFMFDKAIDKDDLLEIHDTKGLKTYTFKLNANVEVSKRFNVQKLYSPSQEIIRMDIDTAKNLKGKKAIANGQKPNVKGKKAVKADVYRIRDTKLLNEIGQEHRLKKPLELVVIARKYKKISLSCNGIRIEGQEVQEASNRPVTKEDIIKQLKKTGETDFEFKSITLEMDDDVFIPMGAVKKLRRALLEQIYDRFVSDYKPSGKSLKAKNVLSLNDSDILVNSDYVKQDNRGLSIYTRTVEQFKVVCDYIVGSNLKHINSNTNKQIVGESVFNTIYLELTGNNGVNTRETLARAKALLEKSNKSVRIFIALPYVGFNDYSTKLIEKLRRLDMNVIDGFMVRTLGQIEIAKTFNKPFVTDYNLHAFNSESVKCLKELGANRSTLSLELNKQGIKDIVNRSDAEVVVYGRSALMHSANCLYKTRYKRCDYNDDGHYLELVDRKGISQKVTCNCEFCYNTIYNDAPLNLLDEAELTGYKAVQRLDFTFEAKNEMISVLDQATGVTRKEFDQKRYTRGHYKRGVK